MSDHDHEMIDPRLNDAVAAGCEESRLLLSRRAMLGVSAGLFSWACLPRHAEAFESGRRLLLVMMDGGLDGLHVAFEASERERLRSYRASALQSQDPNKDYLAGYLPLGTSGFVINSNLSNFASWFNQGHAALVHAIAPPLRTRSHFDCMENLQNGQPGLGNPTKDGWLNRFLAGLQDNQPTKRALSAAGAPVILQGEAAVDSWTRSHLTGLGDAYAENILTTYKASDNPFFRRIGTRLEAGLASNRIATTSGAGTDPSGSTPNSILVSSFRGTARLMKASNGPRIAVLALGGLDTHDSQMRLLDARLQDLDNGLAAFRSEMGEREWSRTVVVCVTEFGRTARFRLAGTDHGTGTVALLAGGNVNGGRVLGDWPGITKLHEGRDLRATLDTRALFKGILRDHLGLWRHDRFLNNTVFPESTAIAPMNRLVRFPAHTRLRLKV
jgi:uncharacterized protein (DUF1501 family)